MFNGNTSVILGIWDLSSNELFCCSISPVWIFATPCTAPHCLLVLHYLLKFALTHVHVHWVNDAIHPSYPLLPPSPVLSLSQHQGLFQWVGSSHQVTKNIGASASPLVLPMTIQDWFPLGLAALISLLVLIVASCPAYRFYKRQVRWSGIPVSLRIFHSLLWSTQSKTLA